MRARAQLPGQFNTQTTPIIVQGSRSASREVCTLSTPRGRVERGGGGEDEKVRRRFKPALRKPCPQRYDRAESAAGFLFRHPVVRFHSGRAAHQSPPETYEKNPVDSSHPLTVPDEVLQPPDSDTYWAPHPETGVFGPADEIHASCHHSDTSPPTHPHPAAGAGEESSSALGQSVWFRPHEADERPPPDYL
ncbi:hypothetical protein AXF42_Ash015485 [Apostasia shenzhenica]|uniref:Uncharacterized protein n=1 Tax=Apostasia shenzhenica TaxID=1088818 RepID=A0A2H9ZSC2_9ASPA|nr:hypothetical protein AXF42_Ash015485 [Apostasia shenzhenica]